MQCELCSIEHNGSYGSGRFCGIRCARRFSTLAKRTLINRKVSIALKGRPSPLRGRKLLSGEKHFTQAGIEAIRQGQLQRYKDVHQAYIDKWRLGLVDGLKGKTRLRLCLAVKRYIFKKYNNKCAECGWGATNPFTHKSPLEIHHINGDRTDNSEANLILLCPNCHSLTFNFSRTREFEF